MTDSSDCIVCKHVLPDVRATEELFRTRWTPTSPATKTLRGMLRVAMAELERAERTKKAPRVVEVERKVEVMRDRYLPRVGSEEMTRTRRVLALMAMVDTSRYGVPLERVGQIPGYAGVDAGWKGSPSARKRLARDLDLVRELRPDVVVVRGENQKPIITLARFASGLEGVEL